MANPFPLFGKKETSRDTTKSTANLPQKTLPNQSSSVKNILIILQGDDRTVLDLLKAKPEGIQIQFESLSDVLKWDRHKWSAFTNRLAKVDGMLFSLRASCFSKEAEEILVEANVARKPIAFIHDVLHPFPSEDEIPESLEFVRILDSVAVPIIPQHEAQSWKLITRKLQRYYLEPENISTHFFLSHKQKTGREIALALYLELHQSYRVFLDIKAEFELHDLERIVQETQVFVFILSDGIFESKYCLKEFRAAVNKHKKVVVVRSAFYQIPEEFPKLWPEVAVRELRKALEEEIVFAPHFHEEVATKLKSISQHA